ncbi:Uncharacterised protein [BD1-7 clade bacterium]|uniref:Uncharacterized protein n=1 Tax=BD1-7 clade bacterium TaxID=2029982 RepID=A0A5S9PSJ8_9GAMM|nr:Uncharacterised protein [BD1-7 clade bacterium]
MKPNYLLCAVIAMMMSWHANAMDDLDSPLATDSINWMYVLTSGNGSLSDTQLTVKLQGQVFAFTDRPLRQSSRITIQQFVSFWRTQNPLSFKSMPPNAVLTYTDADGSSSSQVLKLLKLEEAHLSGDTLILNVKYMNHPAPSAAKPIKNISLFVD